MTATARLQWHPPMIFKFDDHQMSPQAGKLKMRVGNNPYPKGATWQEIIDRYKHDKELNLQAVHDWRDRQYDTFADGSINKNKLRKRVCATVEYEGYVIDGLVALGHIQENETDDLKIIGSALSDVIADVLSPDAVAERLRQVRTKW
jgi:hypothetical protein